ncbi:MAG: HAD family phosphatase [Chloroflexia bacterium]
MSDKRAVVWDLDGVIVDSGAAHNASWIEMARDYDLPYDPDKDFKAMFGRHNTDIIGGLWGITDAETVNRMADTKERLFRREAMQLKALPGVEHIMESLRNAGWKQAIGSSAPMPNIVVLLEGTGLGKYMDAISSGDDVKVGKPDPAVFLIAFERLGVEPAKGVVVEDAPAGVQAAKSAGAACLAVTNTQTREALAAAGADLVVDSLELVMVETMEQLVRG